MLNQFKDKFFESNSVSKFMIITSIILLIISLLLKIHMINYNISLDKLKNETSSIKLSLSTIEKFDQIFPGKWRHYSKSKPTLVTLRNDLNELGRENVKIRNDQGIINFDGQTQNINDITNLINFFYNSKGLVIKRISIDTISDDLIVYNLSLVY